MCIITSLAWVTYGEEEEGKMEEGARKEKTISILTTWATLSKWAIKEGRRRYAIQPWWEKPSSKLSQSDSLSHRVTSTGDE